MDLLEILYSDEDAISTETSYLEDLPKHLLMLETITNISNDSYCFIDYVKRSIIYISDHECILCGHTVEEAKEMGVLFFEKIIDRRDFKGLESKIKSSCEFYIKLPKEDRFGTCFIYDFNINTLGGKKMVKKFIFQPVSVDSKCKLQLALIKVIDVYNKGLNDHFIVRAKEKFMHEFKPDKKSYSKKHKTHLIEQERIVLRLWMEGNQLAAIAEKSTIDKGTCSYYLKSIYRKTHAKNMNQAICIILQTGDLFF